MSQDAFAIARANMVDGHIRTADVTDPALVAALRLIPRERFVPEAARSFAYAGEAAPAGGGRFLLDPRVFAKLAQVASIQPGERLLDVGGATGYSAAVLAHVAGSVVALEEDAALAASAKANFEALGLTNVTSVTGPLTAGCAAQAPYDAILLNGAVAFDPEALVAQLAPEGRLVAIVTDSGIGKAHLPAHRAGLFPALCF
jgi:protein-L-isoaspartate(D-aspartate) O-methyltransferase